MIAALAIALAATIPAATPPGTETAQASPAGLGGTQPNIVVIMTDDQDARSMWAMPKTRRLLRRWGTSFTRAYTSFPLCCPSRATYLTGQHSHNHSVWSNAIEGGMLNLDASETLPVWLQRAGYATAHVGRYLNGIGLPLGRDIAHRSARLEVPPGWTRWLGLTGQRAYRMYRYLLNLNGQRVRLYGQRERFYQTDVLGRISAHLVRRFARDHRPLFLSFATLAAHAELVPEAGGWHRVRPAKRHRDASKRRPFRKRWSPPPSFNAADVSGKPAAVQALPRLDRRMRERIRDTWRARSESLMAVDDAVGRIIRALRETGQMRNTLLIFTSDQGVLLGEHRIGGGKRWLYEESARVPLIIRGPGIPTGARRGQVASNVDLAPTILDAAGASDQPPFDLDGISLLPLTQSADEQRSRAILLQGMPLGSRPGEVEYAGVRARNWAYLEHGPGEEELYDMAADPFQLQSLHAQPGHSVLKLRLRQLLDRLRDCAGTSGPQRCLRQFDD